LKARFNNNKVNIVTLGCSKNTVDSENLLGQLKAGNIAATHQSTQDDFDTVVINTCGFIGDAKQESIDTILRFAEAKKEGKLKKIVVMGCLSERYKADLEAEMPEIDSWYGVNDLSKITEDLGADYKKELLGERVITTPSHYAYLKIAEGCDRSCSFCAIPLIRGKHKSRSIDDIMIEARSLAAKGVKEVLLISQDLTYYGIDRYQKQMITELVRQLSDAGLFEWIRLHYLFPTSFPDGLLSLMAERKNICKYIDIPLQHISDRILRSMKRGANKVDTLALIKRFRAELPDAAIRTAFIVGYPGETRAEFDELLEFVAEAKFDRVGVFTYSHEEDTHAYHFADSVPEDVKRARAAKLMEVQAEIALSNNQHYVGQTHKVLIDRLEGEYYVGRTQYDSPEVDNEVLIKANETKLQIGSFYTVKILSADTYDLMATVVE
jgi:ribosomal protein S12 methylthiotransferase